MKLYGYAMPTSSDLLLPGAKERKLPQMVADQKKAVEAKQKYEEGKLAALLNKKPAAKPPVPVANDRPAYYVGGKPVAPQPSEPLPEQKNYDRIVGIAKSSVNGEPVRKSQNAAPLLVIKEEKEANKPAPVVVKPSGSSSNLNKDYDSRV